MPDKLDEYENSLIPIRKVLADAKALRTYIFENFDAKQIRNMKLDDLLVPLAGGIERLEIINKEAAAILGLLQSDDLSEN